MIINDDNKDSYSTVIQNFTTHPATLPRGIIEYIEIPIIQTTPPRYRVQDVNSLVHSVIHIILILLFQLNKKIIQI